MHEFNWFGWVSNSVTHENVHIITAGFVAFLLIVFAVLYKAGLKATDEELVPTSDVNLKNIFQSTVEFLL